MNKRAQGSLEYLLIIGGAVLVAVIVITLLLSLTEDLGSGVTDTTTKAIDIISLTDPCPATFSCCVGDTQYSRKDCPVGFTCVSNDNCVVDTTDPCPYDCCDGLSGYEDKLCTGGLICNNVLHACVTPPPPPSDPCPYDCCDGLSGYEDKLCTGGLICNNVLHTCVECIDASDCAAGEVCSSGTCVEDVYFHPDLVGYWRFEEASGDNTAIDSAASENLTILGAATRVPSKTGLGTAIPITSVANRAYNVGDAVAYNFEYNQPFSGCAWTYLTSSGTQRTIMGKMLGVRGWELSNMSGRINFYLINSWTSRAIQVRSILTVPGGWNHICFTYDGTGSALGVTLYNNGSSIPDNHPFNFLNNQTIQSSSVFNIGARNTAFSWHGSIDEVMIFDQELSAAEISNLYTFYN